MRAIGVVAFVVACAKPGPEALVFEDAQHRVVQVAVDGRISDGAGQPVGWLDEGAGKLTEVDRTIAIAPVVRVTGPREAELALAETVRVSVGEGGEVVANGRDVGKVRGFEAGERGMARLGALLWTLPQIAPARPVVLPLRLYDVRHELRMALWPNGTIVDREGRVRATIDSARGTLEVGGKTIELEAAVKIAGPTFEARIGPKVRDGHIEAGEMVFVDDPHEAYGIDGNRGSDSAPRRRDGEDSMLELVAAMLEAMPR
ncbi:MAG TPA: hypothetical protein VGM88_12910 [Kofleriaceae bacterium]|jgi:hypothetical protein